MLCFALQKGFGEEEPGLQRRLEEFFGKYGKTNAVRMRRVEGSKEFKVRLASDSPLVRRQRSAALTQHDAAQGSVFVEFADFKSVDAFLNADPKPAWDGKELLIMSK